MTREIPLSTAADLLSVNRTSIYYTPKEVSEEELECKQIIDRLHLDNPTWGARQMSAQLKIRGYNVGRKKARRYMTEMAIDPIYPKENLSKRTHDAHIKPYLLKNAIITRPNQAWSIDVTYIPLKRGFAYLTAIIDWYSRCIVAWDPDDTLETSSVIRTVEKALRIASPEILNSDQGSQFTSDRYQQLLTENRIRQSMDGNSRWADNIMKERWFRSLKYEEVYLTEYESVRQARQGIRQYIRKYNFERCHSAIDNKYPAEMYYPALLYESAGKSA